MKANILRQHGIKAIELDNGVIIADDNGSLKNITDMSLSELYKYLGY